MPTAETTTRIQTVERVKPPSMFRVIYLNDNQTSIDFVIESLVEHFNYSQEGAADITVNIHETGSACVAVLPYEIAEQKGIEVTISARAQSYPLQIKLEPEDVH